MMPGNASGRAAEPTPLGVMRTVARIAPLQGVRAGAPRVGVHVVWAGTT